MSDEQVKMIENLSPSRAKTYMQCPKRFHYESVLKLPTPETLATAKGKLVHYVLDYLFDLPKDKREMELAVGFVDIVWDIITNQDVNLFDSDPAELPLRKKFGMYREFNEETEKRIAEATKYRLLLEENSLHEQSFIEEAKECIKGYYNMENPKLFTPSDREIYVKAKINGISLHGIIDRLDKTTTPEGEVRWFVSDYKTGRPPKEAYRNDAFFQLEVYALILKDVLLIDVHQLRLLYVREGDKKFILTKDVTKENLEKTKLKLKKVWLEIKKSFKDEVWPTNKGVLCDWCHFKGVCPAFTKIEGIEIEIGGSDD